MGQKRREYKKNNQLDQEGREKGEETISIGVPGAGKGKTCR